MEKEIKKENYMEKYKEIEIEKERKIVTRSYMEKLQGKVTPPINSLEEFITPALPREKGLLH